MVKFMRGARAHISVMSHSDNRVFAGFLDLIYDVRTDWATGQQQTSSWRHKTSNILRLLYHITTKNGIQLFHSVCPIQLGPDAGSVIVTFYRKPEILELVEKIAQSPVAWLYWWATEELHISHKCMQLILKGCEMDEVYLINETDWDGDTWKVSTPFEDAEDEFARRVEEDDSIFDMSALAPPTPPAAPAVPTPNAPNQSVPANPTQQDTQATQPPGPAENVTSRGYYMSSEHQAAVDGMGNRDDDSFATRARGAASRVSDATKNTSGAHSFRSKTTVDIKRSYRAECIENAKRKAEEFADSLRSNNPNNLQGTPAFEGPATTAPASSASPSTSASPVPLAAPTGIITDYFQRQQISSTVGTSTPSRGRRRIPTIEELRDAGYKEQRGNKVDKSAMKRERFLLATKMVATQNETRSAAARIKEQWTKGA
eukprot:scaffold50863_cov42-Cyclotella_meneghiniana.AAC.1